MHILRQDNCEETFDRYLELQGVQEGMAYTALHMARMGRRTDNADW